MGKITKTGIAKINARVNAPKHSLTLREHGALYLMKFVSGVTFDELSEEEKNSVREIIEEFNSK